jgi:aldose 1-epimerase
MPTLTLRDAVTGSTARIAPDIGFNCHSFQAQVGEHRVDVIDAAADFASGGYRPSSHGIPLLFPYPNRIRQGRFTWEGRAYHIPPENVLYDRIGNAIHGFCVDRPWRVLRTDEASATAQFRLSVDAPDRLAFWPADALIEVRYEVRGAMLRSETRIVNPDRRPLPWGFGTHPYFRLPLGSSSAPGRCTVEAPVTSLWELAGSLPTGARLPIAAEKNLSVAPYYDLLQVDDVFTGLVPQAGTVESVIIDEDSGLQVSQRVPEAFRELVAFTPPRREAICLEPYTCVTDAINLEAICGDTGLQVLAPGEERRLWIEIEAAQVLA